MKTVVFAEKYSVADDICKALSDDGKISTALSNGGTQKLPSYKTVTYKGKPVIVTWGHGHLCGLKQAQDYNREYRSWRAMPMPFIPESYELKAIESESARVKELGKLFDSADLLINATDFDREGDVIFYYLYTYLKCKVPFKRACFSSLDEKALKKAFDNRYIDIYNNKGKYNVKMTYFVQKIKKDFLRKNSIK